MCALARSCLTPEEYLAIERQATTKSEYLRGEVYAMAGASYAHTTISFNMLVSLAPQLKRGSCTARSSDLRINVRATSFYAYPDIVVICGQPQFEDRQRDTLLNPSVIFEILSRSTEGYDRGEKFAHYRLLESLTDFVLVSQNRPLVEHYARQPDESWLLKSYSGLEAVLSVPSIGCELPLAEIYDKVEWPEEEAKIVGVRLVREESGDYEVEYEFEGGLYANRPDPPGLHR
jgi:Uma2 family endonuclease